MRLSPHLGRVVVMVCFWLAACGGPSATASSTPTGPGDPGAVRSLEAIGCESIDLRGPNGDHVDLNGIWTAPGALSWNIRQLGNCVFIAALEDGPALDDGLGMTDPALGHYFHWVCDGTIAADFTIQGRCVQLGVPDVNLSFNPASWVIGFAEGGQVELHMSIDCPCPEGQPPHVRWNPSQEPSPSASGPV